MQWERLLELVEEGSKGADEPAKALTADQSAKARSNEAAKGTPDWLLLIASDGSNEAAKRTPDGFRMLPMAPDGSR